MKRPALVLSPNSAIQAQWASKVAGFSSGDVVRDLTSTDSGQPAWLTSLTYQSVTLPRRGDEGLDAAAVELWIESLIQKEQADDSDEARQWIEDLQRRNADYHAERDD